jgi:hypothetical protein
MRASLEVTYLRCFPSDSLDALIRKKARELEKLCDCVLGFHVFVDPSSEELTDAPRAVRVSVQLTVPDDVLISSWDAIGLPLEEGAVRATGDAFRQVRRQLLGFVRRQHSDLDIRMRAGRSSPAQVGR